LVQWYELEELAMDQWKLGEAEQRRLSETLQIAWQAPGDFLAPLPNLKVLFSSGAGIDHIDFSAVPPQVQVVRMVEPGIINGMIEYVTMSVLALHRDLFDYVCMQPSGAWDPIEVLPASARSVGVMGLGVLGQAVLERLGTFGFRRYGWNRSAKQIAGVGCYAKEESLNEFLGKAAPILLENLRRHQRGEPMSDLIDRSKGY
jgi:glyoxylate/hydroxypyruvate reductase A